MNFNLVRKNWSIYLALGLYSLLVAGYFFSYSMWHFPDGGAHMGYVYDVIKNNYPDYINGETILGPKLNHLNHPALYYFVTGEFIKLVHGESHAIVIAQGVNVIISVLIIYVVWCTLKKINAPEFIVFLGVSVMLLTPMFLELSVAVNNDPSNILGCALIFCGLINITQKEPRFERTIFLVIIGGFIAVMTKGTGGLAAVCIVGTHAATNMYLWFNYIKKLTLKQWVIIIAFVAIAVSYYTVQFFLYHTLFPAPQGNPADWFAIINPGRAREGLFDYFILFLSTNVDSFIKPYGHTLFIDSVTRVILLKITLVMLIVIMIVMLVFTTKKNNSIRNFIFQGIVSFTIFLSVYFFVVYRMHIQTGYLGAMQARYFYGYLPLFTFGVTYSLMLLRVKSLRFAIMIFVSANLIFCFYPSWITFTYKILGVQPVGQFSGNKVYGPLVSGGVFEQSFIAESTDLHYMKLLLATYARVNNTLVNISIVSMDGKRLFQTSLQAQNIQDNSWHTITTNLSGLMKGEKYVIRLISPMGNENNSITWVASRGPQDDPHFANTKLGPPVIDDGYRGGEAIVDSVAQPQEDFAFQLYF